MKVLLLGATGKLGSRLLPALLAHKHQVVVYVRSEAKLKELIPSTLLSAVTIVIGDATASSTISGALVQNKCDACVNSAGLAAIFPWQSPRMQEIINAVTSAAVDASRKLGHPIRLWVLGGLTAMDVPGMRGTPIKRYFPMFTEHFITFATLSALPLDDIKWSMLCPSQMNPASPTITPLAAPSGNPLLSAVDVPPGMSESWITNIPFFGPLMLILGNAAKYTTNLEDCADFIAADLEQPDSGCVGHRVGVMDAGAKKTA